MFRDGSVEAIKERVVGLAQPDGRFEQRVEHRLQIEGGAADDFEHVGRRCLLLQRLAQFVQQPRILDGDGRLVGKGTDQVDLPLREWLNTTAPKGNDPYRLPVTQ
jgi:hypothetical protein